MTETLFLFVGAAGAFLLAIGVATLVVAVMILKAARRYVELAEERLETLREGQAELLNRLEEQRDAARAAEKERAEAAEDVHTRRGAGRSIERTKRELLAVRHAPQARREGRADDPPTGDAPKSREDREGSQPEKALRTKKPDRPAGLPETRSSGPHKTGAGAPQPRAVKRPHPDDDVKPGSTLAEQVRAAGGSRVQMFRVFYDRYLDNYEGYVKLAERVHQARTDEEKVPGTRSEREWRERLRRATEGIERTAERLDILEHSNPELASDDRVSRRAAIARVYARFAE